MIFYLIYSVNSVQFLCTNLSLISLNGYTQVNGPPSMYSLVLNFQLFSATVLRTTIWVSRPTKTSLRATPRPTGPENPRQEVRRLQPPEVILILFSSVLVLGREINRIRTMFERKDK